MKPSNSRKFFFAYLLFFFAFVSFINFLHSDSILEKEPDCPACQFLQSNLALAIVLFFFLVLFVCLNLLGVSSSIPVSFDLPSSRRARAPPVVLS